MYIDRQDVKITNCVICEIIAFDSLVYFYWYSKKSLFGISVEAEVIAKATNLVYSTLADMVAWKHYVFILLCLNFVDGLYHETITSNHDDIFKSENVVVWFDPFVSLQDIIKLSKYNETFLTPLLLKVSTRFSSIMVYMTEYDLLGMFSYSSY